MPDVNELAKQTAEELIPLDLREQFAAISETVGYSKVAAELTGNSLADEVKDRDERLRKGWAVLEKRLEKAERRLAAMERWLAEDPTRFQIVLRRFESTGEFLCGLRPRMNDGHGRNGLGKSLGAAIDAATERPAEKTIQLEGMQPR
jgi:hypothetical protein